MAARMLLRPTSTIVQQLMCMDEVERAEFVAAFRSQTIADMLMLPWDLERIDAPSTAVIMNCDDFEAIHGLYVHVVKAHDALDKLYRHCERVWTPRINDYALNGSTALRDDIESGVA